jgi:hypothetical protein
MQPMNIMPPAIQNLPTVAAQPVMPQPPFHCWDTPEGEVWTEFYHLDPGFLVRFPGMADYHISSDGKQVTVTPVVGTSEVTLAHLLYNQVIPLAWSHQGRQLLHASAVLVQGRAIAFLGQSGRGKSSLATSFATAGHEFLTDDSVMLLADSAGFRMPAGQPTIRLWQDSLESLLRHTPLSRPSLQYTDKTCILADDQIRHHAGDARLGALFCIGDDVTDRIVIQRIKGQEAILHLIRNSLVLDVENPESLQRNFAQLCHLATTVPMFRLEFPRDYSQLPALRKAVIETFNKLSARPA